MNKFYQVQKGMVVEVKKHDRFSVSIDKAPVKKTFFQGIDSLKIKKQKHTKVALVPCAGINP